VQVASLALGLTAVLLLTFTRNDLVDAWRRSAPPDAPNRFLIGVQPDQVAAVRGFLAERGMAGVLLLEPRVFGDARGFFFESYNRRAFHKATGVDVEFVQDNHSRSSRNVLRGLHYQVRQAQGKLVRVIAGEVWDVAVDLRKSASTFGRWTGFTLSAESRRMAWIPPGFAHGFCVLSDTARVLYKCTDYYAPGEEYTLVLVVDHLLRRTHPSVPVVVKNVSTTRAVDDVVARAGAEIRIAARARSFLHHQVRNMVGTLKLVGEGKWTAAEVAAALAKTL